jgi:hypothetical protein
LCPSILVGESTCGFPSPKPSVDTLEGVLLGVSGASSDVLVVLSKTEVDTENSPETILAICFVSLALFFPGFVAA